MNIKKYAAVYTHDGIHLGEACCLYHRTQGVKPEWEQYASYVHVVSLEMGDDFYIPTDFIAEPDATRENIVLTLPMQEVERRTWTRIPDFIWHKEARKEMLPVMKQEVV